MILDIDKISHQKHVNNRNNSVTAFTQSHVNIMSSVMCGDVRGWAGTDSFKVRFISIWIATRREPILFWTLLVLNLPCKFHNSYTINALQNFPMGTNKVYITVVGIFYSIQKKVYKKTTIITITIHYHFIWSFRRTFKLKHSDIKALFRPPRTFDVQ